MAAPKLITPLMEAIADDGTEYQVQTINIDATNFERMRVKRGWPDQQQAPMLAMTYMTWHALKREGRIELSFDQFEQSFPGIRPLGAESVDPTQRDPA